MRTVGGGRCPIINISGGTEVGACFLSPLPITSLKPCTLRGPALGMDIDVWGASGTTVGPGEVGELVCKKPWPGMTRGIWRNPQRYLDTYWSRWPGVWVHGDWASVDEDGFWFLHGRSDDTMKSPASAWDRPRWRAPWPTIQAWPRAPPWGCPTRSRARRCGASWWPSRASNGDDELAAELAGTVAHHLGKAFKPSRVLFVDELPKTRSAKIVRRALRAAALGEDPGDLSSLENPGAVEAIGAG